MWGCLPYPSGFCCCTLGCPGWTDKYQAIGLTVLHVGEDGPRHLRLYTREVGASSCKRFLNFINEHDDAGRIDTCKDRPQKVLHVLDAANVLKGLTTSPHRQARCLLNVLALRLPEVFRLHVGRTLEFRLQ